MILDGVNKMINACIFDKNGKAVGCITPSVLQQFELQLDNLKDIEANLFSTLSEMLDISFINESN